MWNAKKFQHMQGLAEVICKAVLALQAVGNPSLKTYRPNSDLTAIGGEGSLVLCV